MIKHAIEQHCSLDHIVELTIQILNTFNSSDVVVERVLADLIQVRKEGIYLIILSKLIIVESPDNIAVVLEKRSSFVNVKQESINMS